MSESSVPSDLPPPPAAGAWPAKRHVSAGAKVVLGVVAVALAIGAVFVARSLYWSLRPTPSFTSLAETPDPSLNGTVAFLKPGDDTCVYLVSAAGGRPKKLACLGSTPGALSWRSDGRLQSTRYKGGEGTAPTASWLIDPKTGKVEEVPTGKIPARREQQSENPGPNGEVVTCRSSKGTLTLTMTGDEGTRTLLSVGAPDTYCMGGASWSGDGRWFVVKDDLDRILLVTTGKPSTTRVLVAGAFGPAVTDEELLPA